MLPLTADGLGSVLTAGRRAALRWADLIEESDLLELFQPPELDIVSFFPRLDPSPLSRIDAASRAVLDKGMRDQTVYLSLVRAGSETFASRRHALPADVESASVLRSVLMKPEAETYVDTLHAAVEDLVDEVLHSGAPA